VKLIVEKSRFYLTQKGEIEMARYYADCREQPSISKCSVAISADSKEELVEAAVQHAVSVHEHVDTPELREEVLNSIKEGTPAD
jgi:predicted small metal-binding protein